VNHAPFAAARFVPGITLLLDDVQVVSHLGPTYWNFDDLFLERSGLLDQELQQPSSDDLRIEGLTDFLQTKKPMSLSSVITRTRLS